TPPDSSPPNMRLNTNVPGALAIVGDTGSPRTKVAYNFQGLQLEDGGAVSKLDLRRSNAPTLAPRDETMQEENAVRKRVRVLHGDELGKLASRKEIPETPDTRRSFKVAIGPERVVDPTILEKAQGVILHNQVDPVIFKAGAAGKAKSGALHRAYPSINRLSDSKSRAPRKRMGTPPLFGAAEASLEMHDAGEHRVVDQERATNTWHDDEITGHDPDDPDDDGEGMNGIGFRPTPAMAYARAEKRRAQMQEYKNREAREARAKRSERRRGAEPPQRSLEEEETARRVRFMDAE
ncbi:hypothetical protein B0O99DRAFT_481597, partial [Bisporella sp. PMI_857]